MKELTAKIKNIGPIAALSLSMLLAPHIQAAGDTAPKDMTDMIVRPFVKEDASDGGGQQEESVPALSGNADAAESEQESEMEPESVREEGTEEETETETDTETELSEAEARNIRLNQFLSMMPEGFVFPMVIEEGDGRMFGLARRAALLWRLEEYRGLDALEPVLEEQISGYDGDWSVYVKNLSTGEEFVINDRPMKSASVMKLFILGTVYRAFEAGDLERTQETMALVESMITLSDNEASNQLLYLLGNSSYGRGIEKVNDFIREYGFSDMTAEFNGFENSATVMDGSHFNQVAAKDCGKLLEDIYRRNWVNRAAANEIEQMLLNQHTRYKIPGGLPEGVLCGNKTGEMSTTENDAAIIYSENCDYILVVLSSDWSSKDQAISRIADLSRIVYEYLN